MHKITNSFFKNNDKWKKKNIEKIEKIIFHSSDFPVPIPLPWIQIEVPHYFHQAQSSYGNGVVLIWDQDKR